jgi:hypothetical protein
LKETFFCRGFPFSVAILMQDGGYSSRIHVKLEGVRSLSSSRCEICLSGAVQVPSLFLRWSASGACLVPSFSELFPGARHFSVRNLNSYTLLT